MSLFERTVHLCFVCLGNICRSPAAEAVMAEQVRRAGLEDRIIVDSAGTAGYHVGDPPDRRTRDEAARRGLRMHHSGRRFDRSDFDRFDLILAMDHMNLDDLRRIAPAHRTDRIRLLREFDPLADGDLVVPDPYYDGPAEFAHVFDLCERACAGLLDHLRADYGV